MISLILATVARLALPVLMVFAIHLMLRGHNAPGGGFIAGLMTAAAIVLLYVAYSSEYVRERVKVNYRVLLACGLAVAGATGLAALWYGSAFMHHKMWHVRAPVLGELELATAEAFDFGVYLAVVGVTLMIISILREED
jgi:multicomponent K+:H+ antiporter subunit A